MAQDGFIFLHRKISDWEWYSDANTMRLFIHCLIKANYKDKQWHGILIKKGSFITSYEKLSIELGLTIRQIRTAIDKLKTTSEITYQSTNQYSIISINNWNKFQEDNKQIDNQTTIKRQTNDKRMTTTNKDNKDNKDNNKEKEKEILKNFNEFYLKYPLKRSKDKAFLSYKKAILAAEPSAIMEDLDRYIDDIRTKKTEPRFIKYPSTWLNQGCWKDEYDSCIDYSDPMFHNSRL